MSCFCPTDKRKPLTDEHASETVCGSCGVVLHTDATCDINDAMLVSCERLLGSQPMHAKNPVMKAATVDNGKKARGFCLLDRMLDQVGTSAIMRDIARSFMERIVDGNGDHCNTAMCAMCIWLAARHTGRAIKIDYMKKRWKFKMKDFKRCLWTATEIGIDLRSNADTRRIITRLCSDIGTTVGVEVKAVGLYEKLNRMGVFGGRSPYVVAASMVYLTCDASAGMNIRRIAMAACIPFPSISRMKRFLVEKKCL